MKMNIIKIHKELKRLGWSQVALAKKLRVSPQAVFGILSGTHEARLSTIEDYAKALGFDPKDLITR